MCRLHHSDPDKALQYRLREETFEQHDTPQQPMTGHIQKKGEAPRIIRPKTNYTVQSTKWLTGLGKMQERYSQGTERLQHCVSRLPLRSLEAAEYDTLKLQWIYKTEISKLGSRRKCCSHRSWRDLNERQDTEYTPTPRSTWCIHDITSFTFKINSV